MKRKSSKGNPNHWPAGTPKGGQFAPKGAGQSYYRDSDYYDARTKYRNGELSKEEMDSIKKEYATPQETEQLFGKSFGIGDFVPAKTVSEAEDYCRSLGVEPYYKGLSLDTCNALNESLTTTFRYFPKTKEYIHVCGNAQTINKEKKKAVEMYILENDFSAYHYRNKAEWAKRQATRLVGRVSSRTLAYTYMEKPVGPVSEVHERYLGIYVNSNNKDIDASMKHSEETQFHPQGCATQKAAFDHEMGHIIHVSYGGLKVNMKDISIKDELSEYAMTNVKEYHAEAWSEYCNNPNPRNRAKEVGEEFLRRANL